MVCRTRRIVDEYSPKSTMFFPASGAWEVAPPMTEQRTGAAAGTLLGRLYVCGGWCKDRTYLNSVESFNFQDGTWSTITSMNHARAYAAGTALFGQIFVCGGQTTAILNTSERFHPPPGGIGGRGYWETLPPMHVARYHSSAGAIGRRLYVCGGMDSGDDVHSTVEQWDLGRSPCTWSFGPHTCHERCRAAIASTNGRIYVCGGESTISRLMEMEVLDPAAGKWQELQSMSVLRTGAPAVVFAGQIYVFGGSDDNSVERFDPEAGAWTALPPMSHDCQFLVVGTNWAGNAAPAAST